jgi:SAM-dependent methyltransferase
MELACQAGPPCASMDAMDKYRDANQRIWNEWTRHHVRSAFYDVEGFRKGQRAGRAALDAMERAALGDVDGKSLLHLQCHFGLDTLFWARQGARVTGVDFAGDAIREARGLAAELGLPATFVHSDVYDLPRHLDGTFDIVFTSHGVLPWLPDLERWAQVIARFLRPGGLFFIIEAHPFAQVFDDERSDRELRPRYPYFPRPEPMRSEGAGSYAVPDAPMRSVTYQWPHSIGEILTAIAGAGLRIESLEEYPFAAWTIFPWLEARPDGLWQFPSAEAIVPLMFALKATKPAE